VSRAEGYIPTRPTVDAPPCTPAQQRPPYVPTIAEREVLSAQRGPQ